MWIETTTDHISVTDRNRMDGNWISRREKLPGDGRGDVGTNKTLSNLKTTPEKTKILASPAVSEFRGKVELKVKELIDSLIKEQLDP